MAIGLLYVSLRLELSYCDRSMSHFLQGCYSSR